MLIRVLAGDPRTPPAALELLAERGGLTATETLALATNPNLPTGAPLPTLPRLYEDDLIAALTHPNLPTQHRLTFLNAAFEYSIRTIIRDTDLLTSAEIAHYRAAHAPPFTVARGHDSGRIFDLASDYATNPTTPAPLAREAVDALHALADSTLAQQLLATAAALRHRQPARATHIPGVHHRGSVADFAAQLTAHTCALPASERRRWWVAGIGATADPDLARAALQDCSLPGNYFTEVACALLRNDRLPAALRHEAALLAVAADDSGASMYIAGLAETAPADVVTELAAMSSTLVAEAIVRNPDAPAGALRILWEACPFTLVLAGRFRTTVAAHPNCPAELRSGPHPAHAGFALEPAALRVAALISDRSDALLEAQVSDLHAPAAQVAAQRAGHLQRAYASYPEALTAPGQIHAALALDGPTFPGTLRELLDTATAIAT